MPSATEPTPELDARIRRNVPRIYLLNGSWMFLVVMPVIVPFWQGHGLSMQEIYSLQAIFAFVTLSLELPSGYLADLIGRRNTIVVASGFMGLAFSVLPLAETFVHFVAFECLAAIAVAALSGADIALLYASLELTGASGGTTRAMGQKLFYGQIGETLASLVGGGLALISLTLPFVVNAFTAWIPLCVAFGLTEPPGERMGRRGHRENAAYVYRSMFQSGRFLALVVWTLMLYSAATLIAVWAMQAYWLEAEVPLFAFGLLWAGANLIVALIARFAHRIEGSIGFRGVVATVALLPLVGYFGMGLTGGWLGVFLGISFYVCRGLNQVVLRDRLNASVPPEMRATANSVAALGMRLTFVVAGPLVGAGMDRIGIHATLVALGVVFVGVGLVSALPLWATPRPLPVRVE